MSDLCWTCQQNGTLLLRAANMSIRHKSQALKAAEDHILAVTTERSYYKHICEESKENTHQLCLSNGRFNVPSPGMRNPPRTCDTVVHYSFDMAQQVHYPSDPNQPGPIYFLTPRKCAIFGVCCEGIPRQVTYLIDESFNVGKGANSIISMLHHFFEVHGFGETKVHPHADNCTGQNKNRFMMFYLIWRVLAELHEEITISFLLVGHTKFAPDWCFGLFKRLFKRTKVNTIEDIAEVVDSSAECNVSQLVGQTDGTILVPTYDWTSFFDQQMIQSSLKGISIMHHFRFTASDPGCLYVRDSSSDQEHRINLLRDRSWRPSPHVLPQQLVPLGLNLERQWYLYNKIREFCPDTAKDLVCPLPLRPLE